MLADNSIIIIYDCISVIWSLSAFCLLKKKWKKRVIFYFLVLQWYLNSIFFQNISDEKLDNLFDALGNNTHLETLSLVNLALTDRHAEKLAQALELNETLRVVNVETNFISPLGVVRLIKSLLKKKTVEEFRATNQVSNLVVSRFNVM